MEQSLAKESLLLYPCPGCGSQLVFNAQKQAMECTHCGTQVTIEQKADLVKENSLKQQIMAGAQGDVVTVEQLVYKCNRCGTQTSYSSETPTFICPSCKYEVVNPVAYKTRTIQPSGLIPFIIDRQQSISIFKTWIGKGFWAPGDLDQFARQDALHGAYLPFWTYDAQTDSHWTGYGGRYYYETEYYTDNEGKRQSRQVQRTEWIYRSGNFDHFFDDILIGGFNELTQAEYEAVFPFNLEALVNYDSQYLSGWKADVYDIAVNDGYARAEDIMENYIHDACAGACRIDTYRDLQVDTNYSDQTYKHILLPIWICTYLYKSKQYHFLINGQTGKIHGKKPVSSGKVTVAVLIALIVIAAIIYFAGQS